jgi:hypothetical protein
MNTLIPVRSLRRFTGRGGAAHHAAGILGALTGLLAFTGFFVPAAAGSDVVHTYELLTNVRAVVLEDGIVQLRLHTDAGLRLLLSVQLPLPDQRRQGERAEVFSTVVAEGTPGGLRGFARHADDDADGMVDEDPLDGSDNDGDGLYDEDFAAIGDAMAVVDRRQSGRHLHLESYHWSYAHLRADLLLNYHLADIAGQAHPGPAALELPDAAWREADLEWCVHGAGREEPERKGRLYVAEVPDPEGKTGGIWVGVTPLVQGQSAGGLPRLEKGRLEIPLVEGQADLALGVAPTLLQLRYDLAAAHTVYEGALDRLSERRVPWVVPPLCPVCRSGPIPSVRAERREQGWDLIFSVKVGQNALFDPDRFQLDGKPLGPPLAISWLASANPDSGSAGAAGWSCRWQETEASPARQATEQTDPYQQSPALRHHAGEGELRFHFTDRPPDRDAGTTWQLSGSCLSGRVFSLTVPVPISETAPANPQQAAEGSDTSVLERGSGQPPTLSPELLHNYPNPFREQTQVSFRIPATVGEAFVWGEEEAPKVDPDSAVPYRSSQPLVTLKIYSISGQEVETLFSGSLSVGEYEESWDGTDAHGRPVASGAYFCKLQIEDWAVTKRLVFLR